MKSACCKHEIVIQTDPKNCAYVIISGAQKKTEDYDAEDAETLVLPVDEGKYYSCIEELFGAFLDEFMFLKAIALTGASMSLCNFSFSIYRIDL